MAANEKVTLRYTGSPVIRRVIDEHEWTAENGHEAEVPLELAADLLTGPESPDWELVGKPKAAVLKKLAEEMGAPPDLIEVAPEVNEVNSNG